jgi:hypothetical protein
LIINDSFGDTRTAIASNKKKIKKNTFFLKKNLRNSKTRCTFASSKEKPQGGAVGSSLGSKFLLN